jgi:hypothetical protein
MLDQHPQAGSPPRNEKIIGRYSLGWFELEWSDAKDSWTTCYDGAPVPEPAEWMDREIFVVEYNGGQDGRLIQHEYFFLSQALEMIQCLARTGTRISLYEKD